MCCTTKALNELPNSFRQKSGDYVWEWILRVWDNGGRSRKPDQAEFIYIGPLIGDSIFNTEACTEKKVSKVCLNSWLNHLSKTAC